MKKDSKNKTKNTKVNLNKKENKKVVIVKETKIEKKEKRTFGNKLKNLWKNNKFTIITIFAVALLLTLTVLIEGNEKTVEIDYSQTSEDVQTWYDDTKENKYVVTVLASSTCSHCQAYNPVLVAIAQEKEFTMHWFELDKTTSADLSALEETYNLEQFEGSVPYTFVTYGGKFVTDTVGFADEDTTLSFLKSAGVIK